jgi:hypothetical protein
MMARFILDAGHGPETAGKRSPDGSLREFHFNSVVADLLKEALLQYEGVEIQFAHESNRDVPLKERTDKANAWNADLYFSIHANAYGSGWNDAEGVETYIYTSKPNEAMILAAEVQNRLIRETGRVNRGVKTKDLHVLRETAMTAILAECGFMTNKEEAELLKSAAYRQKCARAFETAIVNTYKLELKQKASAPAGTPIIGKASATVGQAQAWAKSRGATQVFIDLAPLFWEIAPTRGGVDPAVAYAQSAKETGFGGFGGVINESYNNTCGLKNTGGGGNYDPDAHKRFASWREGITAHCDHLALYAGAPGYPRAGTPDPRHFSYIAGVAKTVESLSGRWAPSPTYGPSIVELYLTQLQETKNDWKAEGVSFLEQFLDSPHNPDDAVTFAELGLILKRMKGGK